MVNRLFTANNFHIFFLRRFPLHILHHQNLKVHINNLHLPVMVAVAVVEGNIPIRHLRSPLGFFDCLNQKTFHILSLYLIQQYQNLNLKID